MRFLDSREKADDLVGWILDKAVDGIGPLPSASDLADEYRRKTYANDAERVQALIRWAVAKNVATGFVSGLGGALTLPVSDSGFVGGLSGDSGSNGGGDRRDIRA